MLIVMQRDHNKEDLNGVVKFIQSKGLTPHVLPGARYLAVGITGNRDALKPEEFSLLKGVHKTVEVSDPFKLASREARREGTTIEVGDCTIDEQHFTVIAGPCSVESEEQIVRIARAVKEAGAHILRGGAFKPRSSPYSFQGLGIDGLKLLKMAGKEVGMPVITEAVDAVALEYVYEYADIIQVGARNMHNFALLEEVGKLDKPVMLKRGMSATIDEWLLAAEYILKGGNPHILLCERGVRSFERRLRNSLDLSAVALVRKLSHLPVAVDPSHATGRADMIPSLALASMAAGAGALMVEVHDRPKEALSDGNQAMLPDDFRKLMMNLRSLAKVIGVEVG